MPTSTFAPKAFGVFLVLAVVGISASWYSFFTTPEYEPSIAEHCLVKQADVSVATRYRSSVVKRTYTVVSNCGVFEVDRDNTALFAELNEGDTYTFTYDHREDPALLEKVTLEKVTPEEAAPGKG